MPSRNEALLGAVCAAAFTSFLTFMVFSTLNKPVEQAGVSIRHVVILLSVILVSVMFFGVMQVWF